LGVHSRGECGREQGEGEWEIDTTPIGFAANKLPRVTKADPRKRGHWKAETKSKGGGEVSASEIWVEFELAHRLPGAGKGVAMREKIHKGKQTAYSTCTNKLFWAAREVSKRI